MIFKKSLSLVLISSQMVLGSFASAGDFATSTSDQTISPAVTPVGTPVVTPEMTLLSTVIAAQGGSKTQAQIRTAVSHYVATAQLEGQQTRLEQALVDMGIYTSAQAASFVADATRGAQDLNPKNLATSSARTQALTAEINFLSAHHPVGAEFSGLSCDAVAGSIALAGVGAAVGAVIDGGGTVDSTQQPLFAIAVVGTLVALVAGVGLGGCPDDNE
jgi:hypothetical protein